MSALKNVVMMHHTKAKQGFIMKAYDAVRHQLFEMLEELDERLSKITEDVQDVDISLGKDLAQQAESGELAERLNDSVQVKRAMITQALARIDNGEYGICELCGDKIDYERLSVIPHASMCIKCATQPAGC
ncbi:Transcriptional regulator, TraR/DksA family [Crenothrix polyspora]|uniref:Transcriptional regulator, TraR/DksA family n=2 Tax=Crenothrix polyspora TaxID=360316 RepID=A0A1R4H8F9_9GAMM|nr:Transcriptional regulator, TraR/DksA family [Crenothrix polyspora]